MGKWQYKGNTTNPGKKIWDEFEDEETGQSTLEIHQERKVSNWDNCKHQKWILLDEYANIQCENCGLGKHLSWGNEILKDGKIIKLKNPNL